MNKIAGYIIILGFLLMSMAMIRDIKIIFLQQNQKEIIEILKMQRDIKKQMQEEK